MPIVKISRLLVLAMLLPWSAICAEECSELFILDSNSYQVPERWCGLRIDSSCIADPKTLVRLPDSLCWQDFKIYVALPVSKILIAMARSASSEGILLQVHSGYRSARYQRHIIKRRLDEGQDIATVLEYIAPPGYSEHETGRAVDFSSTNAVFAKSAAYRWLKTHASKYGFRESMPEDSTSSIAWEAWHWYFSPLDN